MAKRNPKMRLLVATMSVAGVAAFGPTGVAQATTVDANTGDTAVTNTSTSSDANNVSLGSGGGGDAQNQSEATSEVKDVESGDVDTTIKTDNKISTGDSKTGDGGNAYSDNKASGGDGGRGGSSGNTGKNDQFAIGIAIGSDSPQVINQNMETGDSGDGGDGGEGGDADVTSNT